MSITQQDNSTMIDVTSKYSFKVPEKNIDAYNKVAKDILNKLSEDFNRVGVDSVIAALLIRTLRDNYYGNKN